MKNEILDFLDKLVLLTNDHATISNYLKPINLNIESVQFHIVYRMQIINFYKIYLKG